MENYNLDLFKKVTIRTKDEEFVNSPSEGVTRIPLERELAESGRVTSIVEYKAGAKFKSHPHPLGEEMFVLEGVFSDEHGDYPAGTYIRNPPGFSHAPFSDVGCRIFVKLNQMDAYERERVVINTSKSHWHQGYGNLEVMSLGEHAALVKWPKGERFVNHAHQGGEEILVLQGEFRDEHGIYPKGTWIRSPHLSTHYPFVNEETIIFVKTGHLPHRKVS
jgi:anti-sigma factor ChrR (cupin superfamily)